MENKLSRRGFMGVLAGIGAAIAVGPGVLRRLAKAPAKEVVPNPPIPDYWLSVKSTQEIIGSGKVYAGVERDYDFKQLMTSEETRKFFLEGPPEAAPLTFVYS